MSTYAVGDLQGCLTPLTKLLATVDFDPANDRLWLAGDLVNRGPQSLQTLEYLYDIRHCVTAVLGNHDLHLLAYAYGRRQAARGDTLEPILRSENKHRLLAWLRTMPLYHYDQRLDYSMVHAGVAPHWSRQKALALSSEVQAALADDQRLNDYLAHMYGNQPDCWQDELAGNERLRVITNYFTRMRFCRADGRLELRSKGEASQAPEGYQPWFEHYLANPENPRIIFGHWAALNGATHSSRAIGLDTGCVWGNCLTLMRLEDGRRWQCDCSDGQ